MSQKAKTWDTKGRAGTWGTPNPRSPLTGPNDGAQPPMNTSGTPQVPPSRGRGTPSRPARSAGGEVARRPQGARLRDSLPFHLKIEIPSDALIISVFVSTPQFWQSSPGSWGKNTFFSTIFNLLLFIKLSSSFGGLKQTWTESGKTNSSETRRRLSLANWLFVAFVSCWLQQPAAGSPGPPP